MSPERIKGNSYTFNADVWALGVIVVEATLGRCFEFAFASTCLRIGHTPYLPPACCSCTSLSLLARRSALLLCVDCAAFCPSFALCLCPSRLWRREVERWDLAKPVFTRAGTPI